MDASVNSAGRKTVFLLLFVFTVINYFDKVVVGLAGPEIIADLKLSPVQFGFVGSCFFFLYSLSGAFFGALSTRMSSKTILIILASCWCVAQFPVYFVPTFGVLIASRIFLGFGEGAAFPMSLHTLYQWYDRDSRNVPSTVLQQAINFSLMIAGPILTYIVARMGWRAAFLFVAILGLLWTFAWAVFAKDGPVKDSVVSHSFGRQDNTVSYLAYIKDPTFIAIIVLYFIEYATVVLFFTWVPTYLRLGLKVPALTSGWIFSAMAAVQIPITIGYAYVSGRMMRAGRTSRVAKGVLCSASCAVAGVFFLLLNMDMPVTGKIVALGAGAALGQLVFSFGPLIIADISPSKQRGALLGIVNAIGTTAGLIAPIALGWSVKNATAGVSAGYQSGFSLVGWILIAAGAFSMCYLNPEKTVETISSRRSMSPSDLAENDRPGAAR